MPAEDGNVVLYSDVEAVERQVIELEAAAVINTRTDAEIIQSCIDKCKSLMVMHNSKSHAERTYNCAIIDCVESLSLLSPIAKEST